jgi:hypothetical protein
MSPKKKKYFRSSDAENVLNTEEVSRVDNKNYASNEKIENEVKFSDEDTIKIKDEDLKIQKNDEEVKLQKEKEIEEQIKDLDLQLQIVKYGEEQRNKDNEKYLEEISPQKSKI